MCVQVGFRTRPLQVRITGQQAPLSSLDLTRITVGIANAWPAQSTDPTSGIWIGDTTTKVNAGFLPFAPASGGYVVKLKSSETQSTAANYVNFTVNYDSYLFVFRNPQSVDDVPSLPWLSSFETPIGLALRTLQSDTLTYKGYRKRVAGGSTVVIPGASYQMGSIVSSTQNVVVVCMVEDESPPPAVPLKKFDRSAFMDLFWQFVFPLIPLLWWSGRIILKLKFRCDAHGVLGGCRLFVGT